MHGRTDMGKFLIITGLILVVVGLLVQFGGKIPLFGRLPGDIKIERENFSFYFPLASSIIVSIVISLILYFINKSK
jgi:hypothetical protein